MGGTVKRVRQAVRHCSLVWFRSDLRVRDNPALSQATCYAGTPDGVIGVYIVSPQDWIRHDWGPVKTDFIRRSLHALAGKLRDQCSIPLFVLTAETFASVPETLARFCREHGVSAVWFNNEPEWDEMQRDAAVERQLAAESILCRRFSNQCIVEPGLVLTREDRPYSMFTPFKKGWLAHLEANPAIVEASPAVLETSLPTQKGKMEAADIDGEFERLPDKLRVLEEAKKRLVREMWPAGEEEAQTRLETFAKHRLHDYKDRRDFPSLHDGTSALSPYLAVGAISARMCLLRAQRENGGRLSTGDAGCCMWISELCWRDFYRHIMHHFPRVSRGRPFRLDTDRVAWRYPRDDAATATAFDRWCRGFTGFPIVDAGMRQLNATGWMHNRLRMVVSMFLVKDLLIDWRLGEAYFMRNLVDGDLASNNGGWQWSASTGNDAQPYFRVFNPTRQGERFDPEGDFVRTWVPELRVAELAGVRVHEPSRHLSREQLESIGYCEPMVDHARARLAAIEAFKGVYGRHE